MRMTNRVRVEYIFYALLYLNLIVLSLSFVDDILLTRRALHSELSKTEAEAQTDAKAAEETETETEHTAPAAVASETEAKE